MREHPSIGARYVIGSGWFSPDGPHAEVRTKVYGDDLIRSPAFHRLWMRCIETFADAEQIVIVDSASPVRSPLRDDDRVTWIDLPFNPGHSQNHMGHLSGWTWSVVLSAMYALSVSAEWFVYLEQDVLFGGEGFVEACIAAAPSGLAFGAGTGTPHPLQQAVFVLRADRIPSFVSRLLELEPLDSELSPERKFLLAASRLPVRLLNGLLRILPERHVLRLGAALARFDLLPIHGGRVRPIALDAPHLYFQCGTVEEVEEFVVRHGWVD